MCRSLTWDNKYAAHDATQAYEKLAVWTMLLAYFDLEWEQIVLDKYSRHAMTARVVVYSSILQTSILNFRDNYEPYVGNRILEFYIYYYNVIS